VAERNPLPPSPEGRRQVQRLRRLVKQSPEVLMTHALDYLGALALLHKAKIAELKLSLHTASQCGCDGCLEAMPTLAASLAGFSVDLHRLHAAADSLFNADGHFEVEEALVAECLGDFQAHCTQHDRAADPVVRQLNSLLEHGGEGEVG
jgi:hypothetical protein